MKKIEVDENVQKQGQMNIFADFSKLRCGVIRYNALPAHTMFLLIFLILFSILNIGICIGGEVKSSDESKTKSKFVIDEERTVIKLLDSKGKEIRKIELKEETKKGKVKGYSDSNMEYDVSTLGYISEDGQYVAIVSLEFIYFGEKYDIISRKISYMDTSNKVLWERQDIDFYYTTIQISQDGNRIAFSTFTDKGEWVIVCDKAGKEIFKTKLKGNISDIFLTKNGKFGKIFINFKTKDNRIIDYVCFSVDSAEIYLIEHSLARLGNVEISEDGEVTLEKGREYYLDGYINRVKKKGEIILRYKFK